MVQSGSSGQRNQKLTQIISAFWSWHAECIPQNGKEKAALAIAVGNGEGCVVEALVNAHLFMLQTHLIFCWNHEAAGQL